MKGRLIRYRGAIFGFMAALLVFMGLFDTFMFRALERIVLDQAEQQTRRELALMGNFTQEALLRNDYVTARQFLSNWVEEHQDIMSLHALGPTGFVLVDFARPVPEAHAYQFSYDVIYAGRQLITLQLTRDFRPVVANLSALRIQMGTRSVLLTVLLGSALWFILRQLAITPLEREVSRRQQAEKKFRDLLEGAPDGMALVNSNGAISLVNAQMEEMFGYSRAELIGSSIVALIPERRQEKNRRYLESFFLDPTGRTVKTPSMEISVKSKDGREFPADISLNPLESEGELYLLIDVRDITERRKAEEKIRRSFQLQSAINEILKISLEPLPLEQQLEQVLDVILEVPSLTLEKNGCIYLVEEDPQVLVMKAQRGFGEKALQNCSRLPFGKCLCGKAASLSQVIFAGCLTELHEIERLDVPQHGHFCVPITSGGRIYGVINLLLEEKHIRGEEEEQFLSSVANTLAGMVERHRTAAEKERLQSRLIESEKLSALGRMTANVAHEIRNPLTAVGGIAKRLDRCLAEEATEKRYTKTIMAESQRLEKILKRVDSFIFDLPLQKEETDLNRLVQDTAAAFAALCGQQKIEVGLTMGDLPPLQIDREKAKETLENVIMNAIDAMPHGGKLAIDTRQEVLQERGYGVVEVRDTGEGIQAENLDTIFEPFFTTRAVGKRHAVGLGLSISKKYMALHEGLITVESRPGEGATFRLFFPL